MSRNHVVPGAKAALDRFKMEAANEVGVNLKDGYNGDLTSKQAGSVGGQMVKKMTPIRMFEYTRAKRNLEKHQMNVQYIVSFVI